MTQNQETPQKTQGCPNCQPETFQLCPFGQTLYLLKMQAASQATYNLYSWALYLQHRKAADDYYTHVYGSVDGPRCPR